MPWPYQWNIGYTNSSGQWCVDQGYNGAVLDGNGGASDLPQEKIDWINKFGLHFYVDHTARKGYLHLRVDPADREATASVASGNLRNIPLNSALLTQLKAFMLENIKKVVASPFRSAYALDDETSWGELIRPAMWRITDDASAYPTWCDEIYGTGKAPVRTRWYSYDDIRIYLDSWSIGTFDASPLMDQWSFNDSYWCNFVGELVDFANSADPNTPCGLVGCQAPSPFGGYDYAKLMRKIQFIEAYDQGSTLAIVHALAPEHGVVAVTTHFHQSVVDDIWQIWYYLAHGNRGHIGWVENWFDGDKPAPWHKDIAPHVIQVEKVIAPLLEHAEWVHDGVAIYYSHPSIQLGWILDSQAHGKTWMNRENDSELGSSHLVRKAWENMLKDSGIQYTFLSSIDIVERGVPSSVKTLILPACLCLSQSEAALITIFCKKGGTVIADYLPGLWDEHGKGRPSGGVLDHLFQQEHKSTLAKADVFGQNLWCEVDQDARYTSSNYTSFLVDGNTCVMDPLGFHKAVRDMPTINTTHFAHGKAVLMNLSPQWYNAYRIEGEPVSSKRETFISHVTTNTDGRWIWLDGSQKDLFGYEITYFKQPEGRIIAFICWNPDRSAMGSSAASAVALKPAGIPISIRLKNKVYKVRDERNNINLGDTDRYNVTWHPHEAIVLSFNR